MPMWRTSTVNSSVDMTGGKNEQKSRALTGSELQSVRLPGTAEDDGEFGIDVQSFIHTTVTYTILVKTDPSTATRKGLRNIASEMSIKLHDSR